MSIEIRVSDDGFDSKYGPPDIPRFVDCPDGSVELHDIPNATTIPLSYADEVEAEGGQDWRGVRLTITRDGGGMQLNAAAANGVYRWELHPAHISDGLGPDILIGSLLPDWVRH